MKNMIASHLHNTNNLPLRIYLIEYSCLDCSNSGRIDFMVQRFNELPFLEKEDRIAVAAKVVFQKAIEDIHSSLKFVTFVSHVINIIFYN